MFSPLFIDGKRWNRTQQNSQAEPLVDVTKYLERAEAEVKRKNFDGAMVLFGEILRLDPDAGEARRGLRRAALKKFEKSYPSSIICAVKNIGPSLGVLFSSLFRAKQGVVNSCEAALRNDPRNLKYNLKLGHALLGLGHRKSAEAAFQVVTEIDPQDVESLKILGQLYYDGKQHEEALKCYERVLKINPRDQDAGKMRKNLAAEGAIQAGGFQTAKSARDMAKSQTDLASGEREQRIVKTADDLDSMAKEMAAQMEKAPDDASFPVKLAKLHRQRQDFDAAVDVLLTASKKFPDEAEILDQLGEIRIERLERRIDEARKSNEPGSADRAKRLDSELLTLQIQEFRRRVESHPTDMALRFRFGRSLLRDNETDQAIEQLQFSVKDPRFRLPSLHLLGRAFAQKGILDLAVKQLTEAIDTLPSMTDQKKELLYDLALVFERQGTKEKALDTYKRIFETDIGFKDVGRKIEALKG